MKVSIEHQEKSAGVLRRKTLHGVKVHVQFSQEELAVIESRNLKYTTIMDRGYSADVSHRKAVKQESRSLGRMVVNAAVNGKDANWTDLTINKLMKGPDLFFLETPLEAKAYEDQLKNGLVTLKDYIVGNEGVEEKTSSFEL